MGVAAGQRASVSAVVADADTAISAGSGDVPVLATPRLLALAEAAAVAAIAPHLPSGMTSVGTSASLEHRRASPVGAEVVVEAELTEVEGRRLMFSFIARESARRPGGAGAGEGGAGPAMARTWWWAPARWSGSWSTALPFWPGRPATGRDRAGGGPQRVTAVAVPARVRCRWWTGGRRSPGR